MKLRKHRILACVLALIMSVTISVSSVVAAEENAAGKEYADFVELVAQHLSMYVRYDDITQAKLYKEALLEVLRNNPDLYEQVMHAMLNSIDEYSEYYNVLETAVMKENITGTVVGIGITFQMCDEGVDVRSVIPDTPAARGGLKIGDIIVSADDTSLAGMNSETAATYIKGDEGASVKLGIKREGENNIIYTELVREKITGTSVTSKQYTTDDGELMYIKVHGFVSNTAEAFGEKLKAADAAGIKNIIIDLRDNGGGVFEQAIQMADMLVPKGSIITTEDHKIQMLNVVYKAVLEDEYDFDVAVLINGNSASASEVLAAALSENDCAKLIGEKSYGKGTIQSVSDMMYGDSIKYTIGYYLTPLGNNINGVGLTPDAVVENTISPFEIDKYTQFEYTTKYSIGDKSPEIKTAKELLKFWGAYEGEINEDFDKEFENAVVTFQTVAGLYPYGVFDFTTQHELYSRMKKSKVVHDDQLDAAFAYFGMTRE